MYNTVHCKSLVVCTVRARTPCCRALRLRSHIACRVRISVLRAVAPVGRALTACCRALKLRSQLACRVRMHVLRAVAPVGLAPGALSPHAVAR